MERESMAEQFARLEREGLAILDRISRTHGHEFTLRANVVLLTKVLKSLGDLRRRLFPLQHATD
jgi:hypothetical protein